MIFGLRKDGYASKVNPRFAEGSMVQRKTASEGEPTPAASSSAKIDYRRFFVSHQEGLKRQIVSGTVDLTKTELRALIQLECLCERGNYVFHTRKHMAAAMGVKQTNYDAALRALIEADFLVVTPDSGKGKHFMINPSYLWKGKPADKRAAQMMYNRLANVAAAKRRAKKSSDE